MSYSSFSSASDLHALVPDPSLTDLGRKQASELNETTKITIQTRAELLVTSPLKRTVATTIIGYPSLRERLEANGKPIVVLPELQEVMSSKCTWRVRAD